MTEIPDRATHQKEKDGEMVYYEYEGPSHGGKSFHALNGPLKNSVVWYDEEDEPEPIEE